MSQRRSILCRVVILLVLLTGFQLHIAAGAAVGPIPLAVLWPVWRRSISGSPW
jgi:hypothetical protein